MPSTILADVALFAWPLATVVLFAWLSVPVAIAASIIGGYLLLPTHINYDLPLLPAYDRELAAALPALVMAIIKSRPTAFRGADAASPVPHALDGWLPRQTFTRLCVIALAVGPFMTTLTNRDPVWAGVRFLPPLSLYDAASSVLSALIMLIPFLLARKYLAHPREHTMLLGIFCIAGLAYSLPTLYEVRMSPQLNNMIYGFFPHDWRQHLRGGGFRPVVFLGHGLRLAIFLSVCVLATVGYMRAKGLGRSAPLIVAALWLLGTLVLCKSLGALIIAAVFAPLILFLRVRTQLLVAAIFALVVLVYPISRGAGVFPMDTVLSMVSRVANSDRMSSLDYRIQNEDILLARANERPLFGWGAWGRNRVWAESGHDLSVTDGTWIIRFGTGGWVGYLATFGLLTIPVALLAFRRRADLTVATSALGLGLAANLVDLIPNSSLTPLTWLMAGAVAGRLELQRTEEPESDPEAAVPVQASPYRRTFPTETPTGRHGPALRRPSQARPLRRARRIQGKAR